MMALLRMELSKLFHSKTLLSLLAVFWCMNFALFAYQISLNRQNLTAYKHIQQDILKIEQQKRYPWIQELYEKTEAIYVKQQLQTLSKGDAQQKALYRELKSKHAAILTKYAGITAKDLRLYTGSYHTEEPFMKQVYQEMETLHQYPDSLKQIQNKAKQIAKVSIFADKDDFSSRNIHKTAQDYQHMQDVKPQYQFEKGITEAIRFSFTDFLIIFLCMGIASTLILEERDNGCLQLLRTTYRGNWKTMFVKALAMILFIVFITFLFFCSNLLFMEQAVGLGNLQAPLISLASFAKATCSLSIGQFLLLFLFTKALALSVCGLLMLWVCLRVNHKAGCFIALAILIGIELIAYHWIDEQSVFVFLKQINLIAFMDTTTLFQRYQNLDFFSYPITLQYLSLCLLLLLFPLFLLGTCHSYQTLPQTNVHGRYMQRMKRYLPSIPISKHLFWQEVYKLGWIEKGVFLLLFCILFQGFTLQQRHLNLTQNEYNWIQVATPLKGKDNASIEKTLAAQEAYFDQLHARLDKAASSYQQHRITTEEYMNIKSKIELQLSQEEVYQDIKEQFEYVKADHRRRFLLPFAYEKVFLDAQTTLLPTITVLLFLLLLLSDIECIEYQHQVHLLLSTTQKGRRKINKHKLLLSMFCAILLAVLCYLPDLLLLQNTYGFSDWHASITSLKSCAALPAAMSILQFFILCSFLKLFALFSVVLLTLAGSKLLKRQRFVLCTMLVVFITPLVLSLLHIHILQSCSLEPLFFSSRYLIHKDVASLGCSFFLYFLLDSIAFFYYQREHGELPTFLVWQKHGRR